MPSHLIRDMQLKKNTTNIPAAAVSILAALLLLASGSPAPAQQSGDTREGIIDIRGGIERQITELEARLAGDADMAAERQAAYRLWLIELYDSTGRADDIIRNYDQIVSLFPYDVGILNRYARYMLERRKDRAKAEELVARARQYAGLIDVTDVDRGTTRYLQASIDLAAERYRRSADGFTAAAYLLEEVPDLQYKALSGLTEALARDGRYEKAVESYLQLLGKQVRYGPAELDRLENLRILAGAPRDHAAGELIAEAVERERNKRRREIEQAGASLLSVPVPGGATLEGTLYEGQQPGAVLYLASPSGTRAGFRLFAQLLFTEGMDVLSLDLRDTGMPDGTGGSPSTQPGTVDLVEAVATAVSVLRDRCSLTDEQIAIVTCGALCETVELALFRHRLRCPVLYLSPLFDRSSRRFADAVPFRPVRPVMVMLSIEDRVAYQSLEYFRGLLNAPDLELLKLEKAGHGIEILKRSRTARTRFLSWTRGVLNLAR